MKEPPLRTTAAGVLSSCGVSAKVSPQILLRLRPRIVWADEGRSWPGIPFLSLFRGFAAKPRATLGMDGAWLLVQMI